MSQALDIFPHCEHIVAFYVYVRERKEEDKRNEIQLQFFQRNKYKLFA